MDHPPRNLRERVYAVIEGGRGYERANELFDGFIVALIIANVIAFCLETVPEIDAEWHRAFWWFEVASVAIFTLEYAARVWTSVHMPYLRKLPPLRARLTFATRLGPIIDLLAILPFYLHLIIPIDLRVLRALRLVRFLKLARYSPAMHTLFRVIANERRSLGAAGLLLGAALLIASTGMYYLEGHAQPDKFGSVPQAAYWAMTTLTTVGYGDVVPHTAGGKFFAMLVMLTGLCILALPVAIISTGFAQEVGRRDFVITWSLMSRIPMLAELDAGQVAEIMPLFHAHHLPPGTEVIAAGTVNRATYFIASGRVQLRATDFTRSYETGDFFGIVSMLEGERTPGAFVTASKCRLLKLGYEDFRRLEALAPNVAVQLRDIAQNRRDTRLTAQHVALAGTGKPR